MKKLVGVLALGFLMCFISGVASHTVLAEEETDYSFGTVKSVAGDQVVVTEYDYEADKDVDVNYTADPAVKLENVDSVAKIAAGDSIEIDFVTKDGKKIAKSIVIEKPVAEEAPAAPAATPEAPAAVPAKS